MISDELREFIADIDDEVVKTQLTRAVAVSDVVEASSGDQTQERLAKALDLITQTYDQAVRNQRDSINRLLEERSRHLSKIAQLEEGLAAERSWRERKTKVGSE